MTVSEKRKVERSNNVLIVNFRHFRKPEGFLLGITNNYSNQGVSFETERLEYNPGEVLELILKHPYSQLSVSVTGEIVWKIDGWYKCMTGLKLTDIDREANSIIKELMTNTIKASNEPSLHVQEVEGSDKVDKEKTVIREIRPDAEIMLLHENISSNSKDEVKKEEIVICESGPDAEVILPYENTSSISNEEIELPAEDKADKKKYRYLSGKIPVNNIFIGLLLIVIAVFAVITLVVRSADIERIQQQILARNTVVVPPLHVEKGNTGPVPDKQLIGPEIKEELIPVDMKKVEKSKPSPNAAVVREPSLRKGEIIFDYKSDVINPKFRSLINKYAKEAARYPRAKLRVEGHSDSIGSELYNLDLAMRRALEVKKLLIKKGINDRRIKVIVYGEAYSESSPKNKLKSAGDRRVDIVLDSPAGVPDSP